MANKFNKKRTAIPKPKVCKPPPPPPPGPPKYCDGVTGLWNTGEEFTWFGDVRMCDHWNASDGPYIAEDDYDNGVWFDNPEDAMWLRGPSDKNEEETYESTFALYFSIHPLTDRTAILLYGTYGCDNRIKWVKLNGVAQPIACSYTCEPPVPPAELCHKTPHEYELDSSDLIAGVNLLQWRIDNCPGWGGPSIFGFFCTIQCTTP